MSKLKFMIAAIIVIIIVAGIWMFFNPKGASEVREHAYGPFVIRMERFTTKNFNINYGWVTQQHISYSVLHNGKIVEFPAALQSNTGFSHLWRVYILKDAPTPTLVAGSQSVFLITTRDNSYNVSPLYIQSTDFIKFQWLDAKGGKPGPAFELFMGDERTPMDHPDTLEGGKYLMINQKLVLHVPTMEKYDFNKDGQYIDNYDKSGDALAFSPDQKIITFPGNFQTWNTDEIPKYGNALVSYDFRRDSIRVLPYSKNDTRLIRPEDLNIDWFNTYFNWDTTGAETILQYHKPDKAAMWQGYFKDNYYHLYPVKDTLLLVFKQFILDYLKWKPEAVLTEKYHEYTGRVFQLGQEKAIFYLVGQDREVALGPDLYNEMDEKTPALIRDIGNAFNEVLRSGKYQEHFTTVPEFEKY